MSELRVPMVAITARVVCADAREFQGRVFVPAFSSRHSGPMRAEEWMNDAALFFPFVPDDGGGPVLFNKREVLMISVPAVADQHDEQDEDELENPVRRVALECEAQRLTGSLHIDMPVNQSRVLDYLNTASSFVTLHDGEYHHLVQKERITRVIELREE